MVMAGVGGGRDVGAALLLGVHAVRFESGQILPRRRPPRPPQRQQSTSAMQLNVAVRHDATAETLEPNKRCVSVPCRKGSEGGLRWLLTWCVGRFQWR